MKLTWKHVSILGTVLICYPLLAYIQWRQHLEQPPKKVYVVHDMGRKKTVKKNRKLYAHLIPKSVDPQEQFLQTILENNLFAPLGGKLAEVAPTYRLIGTHVPIVRILASLYLPLFQTSSVPTV